MINYRVRPVASTQRALAYCDDIRFSMPSEFEHFKSLAPTDLISGQTIFGVMNTIEKNSEDKLFYNSLEPYIRGKEDNMAQVLGLRARTPAEILVNFANIYSSKLSNTKLQLLETDTEIKLSSKRFSDHAVLKYADLMLHTTFNSILTPFLSQTNDQLNIALPFDKRFYGKYADKFETVIFDTEAFSITVAKHPSEGKLVNQHSLNNPIPFLQTLVAAANMLPPDQLNISNIAFTLGCSEKYLLKALKAHMMPASDFLQIIKFKRIENQLIRENWNLKKAAYDFGFKNQSGITKLFKKIVGTSPSEYRAVCTKT